LKEVLKMGLGARLSEEVLKHIELAEKFLVEGRELIDRDPVQASEKLYKAAEEVVKALATALNLEEARKAIESGDWGSRLLNKAAEAIADKLSLEEFSLWWKAAFYLHVEGFHEARLENIDVKRNYKYVEAMVNLAKKIIQRR
jgi:hypothetical protein